MKHRSGIFALLGDAFVAFFNDGALSRGAAISFYAISAAAPILYISAGIAGLVLGRHAASSQLTREIAQVVGYGTADQMQSAIRSMGHFYSGSWPGLIGTAVLVITAGGVFVEVRDALNAIWKAPPPRTTVLLFLRSWAECLLLVLALGVVLLVSLIINASVGALESRAEHLFGAVPWLAWSANLAITSLLIALLFGMVYMILPNRELHWRDVAVGAVITTVLFQAGEILIGWYVGSAAIAEHYGTAGTLIVALTWVYYSTQVFLFGAELTKVWSERHGASRGGNP